MAKISPVSIKYVVHAKFEAEGSIEKPDVIGALFGQTEGLLGEDLELRELQKEGKIGRIEVQAESKLGKTYGNIQIPSALDKTETTLVAAAIETIERIGPSDAKISVERIEDVRGNKREYILDRAKKLLAQIEETMPESRQMGEQVKEQSKISKLVEYGPEKLPAGDISGEEIIVAEGRADIVNLLRNGIKNVIAMNGTKLPETIKELSKEKKIVLFVDGDRGGRLIARNVCDNAKIFAIVMAPDGKEVEELSKKEILASLRKRMTPEEFFRNFREMREAREERRYEERREDRRYEERERREERPAVQERREAEPEPSVSNEQAEEKIREVAEEISGSKNAVLLDNSMKVVKKVSILGLIPVLKKSSTRIHSIVIDGVATASVLRLAEELGVKNIAARNFAVVEEGNVHLISL
jgi:DNA primase